MKKTNYNCLGSALISALFIMAMVAIAATAMSSRLRIDIYRTNLLLTYDKLYLASQLVTFWAMDALTNKTIPLDKVNANSSILEFPKKYQHLMPDCQLTGAIYDLQAKLNLNNLQNNNSYNILVNLIKNSSTNKNINSANLIGLGVQDWISNYTLGANNNIFSNYYLQQKPAYYASHIPFSHISEFRLIMKVTPKIYQNVIQDLSALPDNNVPINAYTASKKILMALANNINASDIDELIAKRLQNKQTFLQALDKIIASNNINRKQLTLSSDYFLVIAKAKLPNSSLISYAVIKRQQDKLNKIKVNLLYQSLNVP